MCKTALSTTVTTTPTERISFWRMVSIPPVQFQRCVDSQPRHITGCSVYTVFLSSNLLPVYTMYCTWPLFVAVWSNTFLAISLYRLMSYKVTRIARCESNFHFAVIDVITAAKTTAVNTTLPASTFTAACEFPLANSCFLSSAVRYEFKQISPRILWSLKYTAQDHRKRERDSLQTSGVDWESILCETV